MMTGLLLALVLQAPLVSEFACSGFSVVVTSPSGEPINDDGRVEVVLATGRFSVPLRPAMFTGISERAEAPRSKAQRCHDGLVAWDAGPNLVILMLSRSGRPSLDLISLALIDLASRKTLEVLDTDWAIASGRSVGPQGPTFRFISREAALGFEVRVVREWLPGDDSPVGAIEDWLAVRGKNGKLKATWLRP